MCDPISVTLAAATALSAGGQIMAGQNARKAGNQQYALANRQADEVLASADYEAGKIRQNAESGRGAAVAAMAASGVKVGEGSALEVERKILTVGEEDAMMTLLNAERQARSIRTEGRMAKDAGYDAQRAGFLGAAGTVLGGAAKYNLWGGKPIGG